jgi:hypothetical protein
MARGPRLKDAAVAEDWDEEAVCYLEKEEEEENPEDHETPGEPGEPGLPVEPIPLPVNPAILVPFFP